MEYKRISKQELESITKYKIEDDFIYVNEIELILKYCENYFKIKNKNNIFYVNKKHKKEIEKLMNKDNLYISDDLTIYVNKIESMNINEDDDLIIKTKRDNIHINKKHKKEIEKLMNKKNLYISDDLSFYVNEIISMTIGNYCQLRIETKNNNIYVNKKHYNYIKNFNLIKNLENF